MSIHDVSYVWPHSGFPGFHSFYHRFDHTYRFSFCAITISFHARVLIPQSLADASYCCLPGLRFCRPHFCGRRRPYRGCTRYYQAHDGTGRRCECLQRPRSKLHQYRDYKAYTKPEIGNRKSEIVFIRSAPKATY